MAKPGPNRTPTIVLRNRGSWLADKRPDKNGPDSVESKPRCPAEVLQLKYAKAFWHKNMPKLMKFGLMTELDPLGFAPLCVMYHKYRSALYLLAAIDHPAAGYVGGGILVRKKHTNIIVTNPALDAFLKIHKEYYKMLREFGCTPSARGSMELEIKDSSKGNTGKERFFGTKFVTNRA